MKIKLEVAKKNIDLVNKNSIFVKIELKVIYKRGVKGRVFYLKFNCNHGFIASVFSKVNIKH